MTELPKPFEFVEKMILETRPNAWVVFGLGGSGILTRTMLGRHDGDLRGSRSISLEFAQRVVRTIGLPFSEELVPTPQILVDIASEVINDTAMAVTNNTVSARDKEHAAVLCTTWRSVPEGVEICSVGSNSVLVFEGDVMQEVIIPHSITAMLQSQGQPISSANPMGQAFTHALAYKNGCRVDEVRTAYVPLLSTTTIAIIVDRRLADAIIEQAVPRNELPSFIEVWSPPGKRIRTSVLISL